VEDRSFDVREVASERDAGCREGKQRVRRPGALGGAVQADEADREHGAIADNAEEGDRDTEDGRIRTELNDLAATLSAREHTDRTDLPQPQVE
jgi:hypothetical protein